MLLSKKKLYKIKKSKNQSQKKYNKKRKKRKKKGGRRRSFSKRKKHLNLKNKSLKFRIKKQKGGAKITFQLIFLTSQNDERNHIMKVIQFIVLESEFKNFLNIGISSPAFIKIIDDLTPDIRGRGGDKLDNIEQIKLVKEEETVKHEHFEHAGLVVNTYNYNTIKQILINKTPSATTGLEIFDALQKYIELEGDPRQVGIGERALELANAVFSDGGDAATHSPGGDDGDAATHSPGGVVAGVTGGDDAGVTGVTGGDDAGNGVAPPRPPSRISVVDVAGDGSSRKSDEPIDNDRYRGDERMDVYTDYVKKTPIETKERKGEFNLAGHNVKYTDTKTTVGETPWTKVPLSLGARDPIHKKSGMGTTNDRDGPSYPHNLVFEITTKNDADGTKTNMNILDAGDGPLTVDAFNELLLKKYRYKKPLTKEELEEQDEYDDDDDSEEEDFGSEEEEDAAVKTDEGKEGKEPEAQTIEEGSVEIQASPSGNSPDPGLTIEIGANTDEEMETRIVIESGPRGSDGVLLGGGKIMSGGNPKKYQLHLDKPLLYKHENPKTAITKTTSRSLKKMHSKFESQLKKKYPADFDNIKGSFNKLKMKDIKKIKNKDASHITKIKEKAEASREFAKAASTLPPTREEAVVESSSTAAEKSSSPAASVASSPEITPTEISNKIDFRLDDNENDRHNLIYHFIDEYIKQKTKQKQQESKSEIDEANSKKIELEDKIIEQEEGMNKTMEIWQKKSAAFKKLHIKLSNLKQAIEEKNNQIPVEHLREEMSGGVKLRKERLETLEKRVDGKNRTPEEQEKIRQEAIAAASRSDASSLLPPANPISRPAPRRKMGWRAKLNLSSALTRKSKVQKIKKELEKLHKDLDKTNQKINKIKLDVIHKNLGKSQEKVEKLKKELSALNKRIDSITNLTIDEGIMEEVKKNKDKINNDYLQGILPTQEDNIFKLLNKYISIKNICMYRAHAPETLGGTDGGILYRMRKDYNIFIDIWFSILGDIDGNTKRLFKNIEEQLSTVYKIIKTIEFKLKLFDIPNNSPNPLLPQLKKLLIYKLTIPNLISSREILIKFLNSIYDGMTEKKGLEAIKDSSIFYKVFLKKFPSDEKLWKSIACVRIMETFILLPTIRIWSENYSKGLSPDKWWINVIFNTNIENVFKGKSDEYIGINDNIGDSKGGLYARCFETTQLLAKIPLLIKDYFSNHPEKEKIKINGKEINFLKSSNENFATNKNLYIELVKGLQAFNDFNLGMLQIKEIKKQNDSHGWRSKRLNLDSEDTNSPFHRKYRADPAYGGGKRKKKTKKKRKTKKSKTKKRKRKRKKRKKK